MTKTRAYKLGDLLVSYPRDPRSGLVGLQLLPLAVRGRIRPPRSGLAGEPYIDAIPGIGNPAARVLEPLAHVKIVGDVYAGGFSQGHSLRNAATIRAFQFHRQHVEQQAGGKVVVTVLRNPRGCELEHRLAWRRGDSAVEVRTVFHNRSRQPVKLELLTSFSLGGITPFDVADASGKLRVHRFRSGWSAEGRLETRTLEELHLERSWSGAGAFSERFGQVGSMPVRKWFPFVAVEDVAAGVTWGAQLAWAGSWQLEISRQHDDVCLSGGLADREFGHWMKTLAPGESIETPAATLSCVRGGLDELCDRLTAVQQRAVDLQPGVEQDLPVIFNEWATTWGDPAQDKVVALARRLRGSPVRYLVIDAGWYKTPGSSWWCGQGDWKPSAGLFPRGLEAAAEAIRREGLIPGLWFEFEVAGKDATAFKLAAHQLRRDGVPVTVADRRFWDLNDPWVVDYLSEKVIGLLERCGFGYLKVDYNETLGIGCDHPDSLGEGLRQQVLGIYRFFDLIRARLPELVIENCSSGGHRLEPSMLGRTAMSSFSDAHELVEIPIIAANLHRLLLPRQSQIWAVLHRSDSDRRLHYSLSAAFLGRMCLSGGLAGLKPRQWQIALDAQRLYGEVAPVIKQGTSRRFGEVGASWRHPEGWQAVRRISEDGRAGLVVVHGFKHAPRNVRIPLPPGRWRVAGRFSQGRVRVVGRFLDVGLPGDFSGAVVHIQRTGKD